MGNTRNIPYSTIVNEIETACLAHLAVNSFAHGTLDYLDASSVDKTYPYMFLRPMSSALLRTNRVLSFEFYSLDKPGVGTLDNKVIMSNTEKYLYDIISWFNFGDNGRQQIYEFKFTNITPVNEAFQDRLYGWVANLEVTTPWMLDYCIFPQIT